MNLNADALVFGFIWYVVFLFSTTCHEASHALVAKLGGDDTAERTGQVTLNPMPHIRREPWGMVVIPILSFFCQYHDWMGKRRSTQRERRYPGGRRLWPLPVLPQFHADADCRHPDSLWPCMDGFVRGAEGQPAWHNSHDLLLLNLLLGVFNFTVPPLGALASYDLHGDETAWYLDWLRAPYRSLACWRCCWDTDICTVHRRVCKSVLLVSEVLAGPLQFGTLPGSCPKRHRVVSWKGEARGDGRPPPVAPLALLLRERQAVN
jgi:hypothetical protein